MVIDVYYINGYWWLFMVILLMAIGAFLLMHIRNYSISGYWLLFY
jgi:hypothetical protein